MSATSEKIAHDKWIRDLKDNNIAKEALRAMIHIYYPGCTLKKSNQFKRLQLI